MQVLKSIWDFFQNQVLAMKWLNTLIGNALGALGLDTANRWVGSLQFFVYDVIKITVLLCALIFLISLGTSSVSDPMEAMALEISIK